MFFIECLPYILKSSKETHRFRISFNLELYQIHAPPPMFMTLFLERMGALSATKHHVPPRHPPRILNVLPMYRYILSGKQLFQTVLCSKYDFQIVQIQKFQKNFRKSIIMVNIFRYLTILVVATHRYSIKTVVRKYFVKFIEKHVCRSLFLITM